MSLHAGALPSGEHIVLGYCACLQCGQFQAWVYVLCSTELLLWIVWM